MANLEFSSGLISGNADRFKLGTGSECYIHNYNFTMTNSYTSSVPYDLIMDPYTNFNIIIDWNWLFIVECAGIYTAGATIRRLNKTFLFNATCNAAGTIQSIQSHGGIQTLNRYETTAASWSAGGNSATAGAFRAAIVSNLLYLRFYNTASPAVGSTTEMNVRIIALGA